MGLKTITLQVPESMAVELETMAQELGISMEELISSALEYYLDYLDLQVVRERERAVFEGKSETISAEKVWQELGL